jgi:glycosyltransferase involved in cell wall biosynthesis
MAAGCLVIGSRTPPVEEAIDGVTNGHLVDFFDVDGIADRICTVLRNPGTFAAVRAKAREHVLAHYDLKSVCLPAHLALIRRLTGEPPVPRRRSRRAAATRQAVSA